MHSPLTRVWSPTLFALTLVLLLSACGSSPIKPAPPLPAVEPFDQYDACEAKSNAVVDALASEDYERARLDFSDSLRQELSALRLSTTWETALAIGGAFQKRLRTDPTVVEVRDERFDAVMVRVELETTNLFVLIVFDDERNVDGLWMDTYDKN